MRLLEFEAMTYAEREWIFVEGLWYFEKEREREFEVLRQLPSRLKSFSDPRSCCIRRS